MSRLYVLALVVAAVGVLVLQHDGSPTWSVTPARSARRRPGPRAGVAGAERVPVDAGAHRARIPAPDGWGAGGLGRFGAGPVRAGQHLVLGGPHRPSPSVGDAGGAVGHRGRARDAALVPRRRVVGAGRLRRRRYQRHRGACRATGRGGGGDGRRRVPWVLNPAVRWVARRRGIADVPSLRWGVEAELCAHLVAFWITSAGAFVLYLSAFPGVDAPMWSARLAGSCSGGRRGSSPCSHPRGQACSRRPWPARCTVRRWPPLPWSSAGTGRSPRYGRARPAGAGRAPPRRGRRPSTTST